MDTLFAGFRENGLLGLIMGSVVILLFFVIKWTLETTKEILKQAAEERKIFNETIKELGKSVDGVCNSISNHDEKANQRAQYVREEHKNMIETLQRINGYKNQ